MGRYEFVARVTGLSADSRFLAAWRDGRGPDPSVDESIALLDGI